MGVISIRLEAPLFIETRLSVSRWDCDPAASFNHFTGRDYTKPERCEGSVWDFYRSANFDKHQFAYKFEAVDGKWMRFSISF